MAFDPVALGNTMIDAGKNQIVTGGKLQDGAVALRGFGDNFKRGEMFPTSIDSVRDGVKLIRNLLSPVVSAFQFIENALNSVRVPTISVAMMSINFPVIGRVRFVIGIIVGSTWPFTGIAARLELVRNDVANIRAALKTMADDLLVLRRDMPTMRTNLTNTADDMDSSGAAMIASGKAMQKAGRALGGG